jgi:hypothetical protein
MGIIQLFQKDPEQVFAKAIARVDEDLKYLKDAMAKIKARADKKRQLILQAQQSGQYTETQAAEQLRFLDGAEERALNRLRQGLDLVDGRHPEAETGTRPKPEIPQRKEFTSLSHQVEGCADDAEHTLSKTGKYLTYLKSLLVLRVRETHEIEADMQKIRTLLSNFQHAMESEQLKQDPTRMQKIKHNALKELDLLIMQAAHFLKLEERAERKVVRVERRIFTTEADFEKADQQLQEFLLKTKRFIEQAWHNQQVYQRAEQQFGQLISAMHSLNDDFINVYRPLLAMTRKVYQREQRMEASLKQLRQMVDTLDASSNQLQNTQTFRRLFEQLSLIEQVLQQEMGTGSIQEFFPGIQGEVRALRRASQDIDRMIQVLEQITSIFNGLRKIEFEAIQQEPQRLEELQLAA